MGAAYSGSKNKPTATEILKREKGDLAGADGYSSCRAATPCPQACTSQLACQALVASSTVQVSFSGEWQPLQLCALTMAAAQASWPW